MEKIAKPAKGFRQYWRPSTISIKHFFFVTDSAAKQAGVFVLATFFHASLIVLDYCGKNCNGQTL